MKHPTLFRIVSFLFVVLYVVSMKIQAQDYQQAVQQARQYDQAHGSAAIYEEPLYVTGKHIDLETKNKSYNLLELREAGGRLRHVTLPDYPFWLTVAKGETVTGEVWQDKVRRVKGHEQSQQTATNPHYQVQEQWRSLLEWGVIGLFMIILLILGNWYSFKAGHRLLETERNDEKL